jgi:hypothetical protein
MEAQGATPYLMSIPGYRVYAAGVFELNELNWRDKLVFNLNWRNFNGLKVEFKNNPDFGFEVGMGPGKFFTILNQAYVDTTKLNDFLDAVSYLTVDQFIGESVSPLDTMASQTPAVMISIEDVSGREYTLGFFDEGTDKVQRLGVIQGSTYALFNPIKLAAVVRPKSWFLVSP